MAYKLKKNKVSLDLGTFLEKNEGREDADAINRKGSNDSKDEIGGVQCSKTGGASILPWFF